MQGASRIEHASVIEFVDRKPAPLLTMTHEPKSQKYGQAVDLGRKG
jgi:hypothetical protein